MTPALQITRMTKLYSGGRGVRGVSLSLMPGDVCGLLGPNGSGKTTIMKVAAGLIHADDGEVSIFGADILREYEAAAEKVGCLIEAPALYGHMSALKNLRLAALTRMPRAEVADECMRVLRLVHLERYAADRSSRFSLGMRQRLGIADVLIKDPEVIIMDEPTLGIDPEGMRELLNLMRELSEQDGRTLLISSHQLHQIQQVCDRVGIFVDGKLIACGNLKELEQQIRKDGHFELELGTAPCDDKLLGMLQAQKGIEKIDKQGDLLLIHARRDIRPELSKYLGENGYTVLHMHQRGGDLDEIYRRYFEKAGQSDERNQFGKEKKGGFKFRKVSKGKA